MSMPGFVFYFRCEACDVNSDDYSVYFFPNLFESRMELPAWSVKHKMWAHFYADVSFDQRTELEANRELLHSMASSLSTDGLTIGVQGMTRGDVHVTPDPVCPYCGQRCLSVFGYPPQSNTVAQGSVDNAE